APAALDARVRAPHAPAPPRRRPDAPPRTRRPRLPAHARPLSYSPWLDRTIMKPWSAGPQTAQRVTFARTPTTALRLKASAPKFRLNSYTAVSPAVMSYRPRK